MSWLISLHYWRGVLLWSILISVLVVPTLLLFSNLWIIWQTQGRLYNDIEAIPPQAVGLVLGTSKYVGTGRINLYFKYRIEAAAALYKAGKVQHLLVSGDNRSHKYNETAAMQKSLIEAGVPKHAISLDYAGFRTLDSVVRAKKIFSQQQLTIISQAFHNQRALFISDAYGIDAIAFNAQDVAFQMDMKTRIRELFARFKAVLDLYVLNTQPRFLGEKVPIILTPPTQHENQQN